MILFICFCVFIVYKAIGLFCRHVLCVEKEEYKPWGVKFWIEPRPGCKFICDLVNKIHPLGYSEDGGALRIYDIPYKS